MIALYGASGQVGVFALARLVAAGRSVIAVSRHGPPPFVPNWTSVRWTSPAGVDAAGAGRVTTLVSAGPLSAAVTGIERLPGIERVCALSTTSIYTKARSPSAAERRQIADILDAERRLAGAVAERSASLCLLRPTLIYGAGMDESLTRVARWIDRYGRVPVRGDAAGLRQPVHAGDVAEALVSAVLADPPVTLDGPLCGGSTVPYRAMIDAVFAALGRTPRILAVPPAIVDGVIGLAGGLSERAATLGAMLRRQAEDLCFDDSEVRRLLDLSPRAFAPVAADFSPPTRARLERLAGQANLR